ncbi:hypothetical protein [Bacillus marinisedimentorum]|uniref:hypothetical protein n=1 Tax=Bacillus marinisedimentorum TaxID=1821260 RepID=UPI000871BA5D|nr:hypothetical protein [Bacillus marinisedimentorum]
MKARKAAFRAYKFTIFNSAKVLQQQEGENDLPDAFPPTERLESGCPLRILVSSSVRQRLTS